MRIATAFVTDAQPQIGRRLGNATPQATSTGCDQDRICEVSVLRLSRVRSIRQCLWRYSANAAIVMPVVSRACAEPRWRRVKLLPSCYVCGLRATGGRARSTPRAASSPSSASDFEDALSGNGSQRNGSFGEGPTLCTSSETAPARATRPAALLALGAHAYEGRRLTVHHGTPRQTGSPLKVGVSSGAGPSGTDEDGYASARSRGSGAGDGRATAREQSRLRVSSALVAAVRLSSHVTEAFKYQGRRMRDSSAISKVV